MNRRHVIAAIAAAFVTGPGLARTRAVPPVEFDAEDFAAVSYSASTPEEKFRSLTARVSLWADEDAAEEHRLFTIDGAGSDLPDGEFYQADPVEYPVPDELAAFPATIMGWRTTVGVAADRTEWVLLSVRREMLVWDLRISGAETEPVLELAGTMAADLVGREIVPSPDGDLWSLLPINDDVPEGLSLEYLMSPEGTVDDRGTPIPEPTPE